MSLVPGTEEVRTPQFTLEDMAGPFPDVRPSPDHCGRGLSGKHARPVTPPQRKGNGSFRAHWFQPGGGPPQPRPGAPSRRARSRVASANVRRPERAPPREAVLPRAGDGTRRRGARGPTAEGDTASVRVSKTTHPVLSTGQTPQHSDLRQRQLQ